MITKINSWWKKENEKIDKSLDVVVFGLFDALIRKPLLNGMVHEMKKAEHDCRVNLFVINVEKKDEYMKERKKDKSEHKKYRATKDRARK